MSNSIPKKFKMKTIKILTAGEGAVGKTTFLNRFINHVFVDNFEMTEGVQFFGKIIEYGGNKYNLVFWDFAGQYTYRHLLSDLSSGSSGAFFLFDTTRLSSIYKIEEWIELLLKNGPIPIILIGTKQDEMNIGDISYFKDFAEDIMSKFPSCFTYLNVSSKTGFNVHEAFNMLFDKVLGNK